MQNTAYGMRISDWSSDVCSSDLLLPTHKQVQRIVSTWEDASEGAASGGGALCARRVALASAAALESIRMGLRDALLRHLLHRAAVQIGRASGRKECGSTCR